jgi:hypothetical protein
MARKKKRGGGRRKIIRISAVAGAAGGGLYGYQRYKEHGAAGLVEAYSGYNLDRGDFNIMSAKSLHATIAGAAISMIGAKLGLNRYLPKGIGL